MHRLNDPVYRNRTLQVIADLGLVSLAFYLAFRLRFLDVYAWRDSRWQLIASQDTRLPR